jgi:hypothetical protein
MSDQNTIDTVYGLLFSGKADEAVRLIEKRREEVSREMDTLDALHNQYRRSQMRGDMPLSSETDKNMVNTTDHSRPTEKTLNANKPYVKPSKPSKASKAFKNKRRNDIITLALSMPPESTFTSDDIRSLLVAQDYEFGVPENRISTTIGGILSRDENFDRIDTGLFKKKEKHTGLFQVN